MQENTYFSKEQAELIAAELLHIMSSDIFYDEILEKNIDVDNDSLERKNSARAILSKTRENAKIPKDKLESVHKALVDSILAGNFATNDNDWPFEIRVRRNDMWAVLENISKRAGVKLDRGVLPDKSIFRAGKSGTKYSLDSGLVDFEPQVRTFEELEDLYGKDKINSKKAELQDAILAAKRLSESDLDADKQSAGGNLGYVEKTVTAPPPALPRVTKAGLMELQSMGEERLRDLIGRYEATGNSAIYHSYLTTYGNAERLSHEERQELKEAFILLLVRHGANAGLMESYQRFALITSMKWPIVRAMIEAGLDINGEVEKIDRYETDYLNKLSPAAPATFERHPSHKEKYKNLIRILKKMAAAQKQNSGM